MNEPDLDLAAFTELARSVEQSTPAPSSPSSVVRVDVELDTGEHYAATLDARDRRAYALLADRYGLPPFTVTEGSVDLLRFELLTTFSAWNALHHRLHVLDLDWPAFNARVVDVTTTEAPEVEPHPLARGDD